MTTFPSDPGEQERGKRRVTKRGDPRGQPQEPDLFVPATPPKRPSEGDQRKDKAIEKHQKSSRAPLLRFLRKGMKELYAHRKRTRPGVIDGDYVTADDAVKLLEATEIKLEKADGTPEPRNWLGALFKEPGWKYTGRSVPSLRKALNGRHVRCWRWEGA